MTDAFVKHGKGSSRYVFLTVYFAVVYQIYSEDGGNTFFPNDKHY